METSQQQQVKTIDLSCGNTNCSQGLFFFHLATSEWDHLSQRYFCLLTSFTKRLTMGKEG